MTYLFELNHPKHYHQFKHIISQLGIDNKVIIIAREKEVLFELLDENNVDYIKFLHSNSGNLLKKIASHIIRLRKLLKVVYKHKPNFFLSKASVSTIFVKGFFPKCKTAIFPDSEVVWLTNKVIVRFADFVFTPENFEKDFGRKHIRVPGIFENLYLSPQYYKVMPVSFKEKGFDESRRTVFLRFVGWKANHDIKKFGFTLEQKEELVELFIKYSFNILISSEANLSNKLNKYVSPYSSSMIHNVLTSCSYYVGDSQTMASEAALLGLKSFRYNSFVGENDMSNFKYLEEKGLLKNFNSFKKLYKAIEIEIMEPGSLFLPIGDYWEKQIDQNQFIYEHLCQQTNL